MKRILWMLLGAGALWALQAVDTAAVPQGACGCSGSSSSNGGGSYFDDPVIA